MRSGGEEIAVSLGGLCSTEVWSSLLRGHHKDPTCSCYPPKTDAIYSENCLKVCGENSAEAQEGASCLMHTVLCVLTVIRGSLPLPLHMWTPSPRAPGSCRLCLYLPLLSLLSRFTLGGVSFLSVTRFASCSLTVHTRVNVL